MKRKIAAIFVCMLVAICSAFNIVASKSVEKQILFSQTNSNKQVSNTLITDYMANRVIEVDIGGTIIWQKTGLNLSTDAERLANGNTLITEAGKNRVIEVDTGGTIVWQYTAGLSAPWDAERLSNGNTLIADTYNHRVIEVNSSGAIVWQKTGLNLSTDAERFANGNTLIADLGDDQVIEVDSSGTIVWQKTGLNHPIDVERLGNGNTLITEYFYGQRVIEVNSGGNIVWVYNSSAILFDAERLINGNTLITEGFYYSPRVIEVDSSGTIVWQKGSLSLPTDAERIRINHPPTAPIVDGPFEVIVGEELTWTFHSDDEDGDMVKYHIDWGDDTSTETVYELPCYPSPQNHTFQEIPPREETNITVFAEDEFGLVSNESVFKVTFQRFRAVYHPLHLQLFERFPNLFPILRYLLRLY